MSERPAAVTPEAEGFPRLIAVRGVRAGVGTSTVLANMATIFARSGWKVAAVELEKSRGAFSLGDIFAADRIQLEQGLWFVSHGELEASLASAQALTEPELVFLDLGSRPEALVPEQAETVIVLTPKQEFLSEAVSWIEQQARQGRFQAGVIVNQARDGAEAQRVFRALGEAVGSKGALLSYVGHCGFDEKIIQAVRKRKFLLDLDTGALSIRCFELLVKRLRNRYLEDAAVEDDRIVTRRQLPLSRFKEEPARAAPGNRTGFWRTLLGEVKA